MSLLDKIIKPKWQNKDPKVRLNAVKNLSDEEKLAKVAIYDSEENIALVAVERIRNDEILEKIVAGKGTEADLEKLETLSNTIKDTALCGLGQTAPNPILSTLHIFKEEYIAHVRDKKCPAGQCTALLQYHITDKCMGCTACSRVCPVGAISGTVKKQHQIDQSKCIKCGACMSKCHFHAIVRE